MNVLGRSLSLQGADNAIRSLWDRVSSLPFGALLFDKAIARAIPYTGSISPHVRELRRGYAEVEMRDKHALRNHLRSLHAVALANLAEYTGNLALAYSLPERVRFIVKAMSVEYTKKARGTIVGECTCPTIETNERREVSIEVSLRDGAGDVVAKATLLTLVGPIKD